MFLGMSFLTIPFTTMYMYLTFTWFVHSVKAVQKKKKKKLEDILKEKEEKKRQELEARRKAEEVRTFILYKLEVVKEPQRKSLPNL